MIPRYARRFANDLIGDDRKPLNQKYSLTLPNFVTDRARGLS